MTNLLWFQLFNEELHSKLRLYTKFIIRVRIILNKIMVILLGRLLIYMIYRIKHTNVSKSTGTFLSKPYTFYTLIQFRSSYIPDPAKELTIE